MELGDPALEVYLLPVTLAAWAVLGGEVTLWAGSGAAGVMVLVRAGLTGAVAAAAGAGAGCWVTDVRRVGTGAGAAGVAGVTGAGGEVVTVVGVAGVVGEVVVAVAEAPAASFALFSCLILSISSSS